MCTYLLRPNGRNNGEYPISIPVTETQVSQLPGEELVGPLPLVGLVGPVPLVYPAPLLDLLHLEEWEGTDYGEYPVTVPTAETQAPQLPCQELYGLVDWWEGGLQK